MALSISEIKQTISKHKYAKDFNMINTNSIFEQQRDFYKNKEKNDQNLLELANEVLCEENLEDISEDNECAIEVELPEREDNTACKENDIKNVPGKLSSILSENKENYYRLGVSELNNFLLCILSVLDIEFSTLGDNSKKRAFQQFKFLAAESIEEYYKKYNYRKWGFKRSKIQSILIKDNYGKIDLSVERYIADYFDINLMIVNIDDNSFRYSNIYSCEKATVILIENSKTYETIINTNGNNLHDILKEDVEKNYKYINQYIEDEKLNEKIKNIKKMKIDELRNLAEEMEISLIDSDSGKKKLKSVLMEEIIGSLID